MTLALFIFIVKGEFFPLDSHEDHDLGWVLGAVAVSVHDKREDIVTHMSMMDNSQEVSE